MNKVPVFVYGTLKKGFRANNILEDCEFIGKEVIKGFSMYNYMDKFPFIVRTDNKEDIVCGEIYLVPIDKIAYELDIYEGYNPYALENLYIREVIDLSVVGSGIYKNKCFVYVQYPQGIDYHKRIESGEWNIV